MEQNNSKATTSIISKILTAKKTTFQSIEDTNLETMIKNLNAHSSEEENLTKILEFKKSDEKCLESYLYSLLNNKD